MQKDVLNKLYTKISGIVPKSVFARKNKSATWEYGYNEKYDIIVISKTGKIGEIIRMNSLNIALPETPNKIKKRDSNAKHQYWERHIYPKQIKKISTIFQWNEQPIVFKNQWVDYIEQEFDYREFGYWFYNNGEPTYITGSHYMYLQWTKIDVGYPDFREAN